MNKEKLAVMKGVGFGCRDTSKPCLFFTTYTDEHSAALQIIRGADALQIIQESGVSDVKDLENHLCWVSETSNRIIFIRLWKE